jgi:D-galactarolactone cycloisomerase
VIPLKITRIETYPLAFPQRPAWGYAKGWVESAPALLVEVHTDAGLSGWGEGYGPPGPIEAMIRSLCEPAALGADPFRTEALWSRLYHDARDFGAASTALAAISAVDIACWDIKGKALGVPVCALLGGPVREELPCYASTVRYLRDPAGEARLADPAELALDFAGRGHAAIKMAVGLLPPPEDLARVRRVREALPDTVELMVDANHAYTARQAAQVGAALQDLDVAWFEDPLPPDDLPGYESLRRRLSIPLAGGEALGGVAGFREVISRRLFDIILPETGLAGGLTECKKIVDLAYAFGVECTPHGYASAVGTAAALHLAAALPPQPSAARPNWPPFEWAPEPFNRANSLLATPFDLEAGNIRVPLDRPGLGIEIDRGALSAALQKTGK